MSNLVSVEIAPREYYRIGTPHRAVLTVTGIGRVNKLIAAGASSWGITEEKKVRFTGNNAYNVGDVSGLTQVEKASSYVTEGSHIAYLLSDGTAISRGYNSQGQINIGSFSDLIDIAAGPEYTVGVRSNGTCVAAGVIVRDSCPAWRVPLDVSGMSNISKVFAGGNCVFGITPGGGVIATGLLNYFDLTGWGAVKKIYGASSNGCYSSLGWYYGLRTNGTIARCGQATGEMDSWTNIVDFFANQNNLYVGLTAGGTINIAGPGAGTVALASTWTNIIHMSASGYHILGLRSDGVILAAGQNGAGQCNVSTWGN
jgi:hypothetical protein